MTRDEIDRLWQKALHGAILAGEQYTRYHFADLVAAEQQQRIEQLEADTQEVNAARIYLREKGALLRDLAASQAQIKVLREAMRGVMQAVPLNAIEEVFQPLLSTPHDDSALQAAILAEREACAVVCEGQTEGFAATSTWDEAALSCAAAIRARGDSR